jgi:hypothetical protein
MFPEHSGAEKYGYGRNRMAVAFLAVTNNRACAPSRSMGPAISMPIDACNAPIHAPWSKKYADIAPIGRQ